MVNTGDGKGKTTAALGAAMRAAGHGRRVLMLQFIKGPWPSGEHESVRKLEGLVQIRRLGAGFVDKAKGVREEDVTAAREALEEAAEALASGSWEMVILDEVLYAIDYGLLTVGEVVEVLRSRRPGIDVILTGRSAPAELIELADTVTQFRKVRHPFEKGIKARRGIEY